MPELLRLPRFPAKGAVKTMMRDVAKFALSMGRLKRSTLHIVMLVPKMYYDSRMYPNHPLEPHLLAEYTHGDRSTWKHDFADIAKCKALQLWHERSDGGTDSTAHLLFPGDTPFWGGVRRDGIVVACSGVQPWFDRMISGMVADAYIACAHDDKVAWLEANPDEDYLDIE